MYDYICSRCVGICPEGTYSSQVDKLCLPCHSKCGSCRNVSENSCISCKSGLFLIPDATICAESCPENYYTGKSINSSMKSYCVVVFFYKIVNFENVFVVKLIVHHVKPILIFVPHVQLVMLSRIQIV